jgi:glucose/arabinose dehydrogenase
MRLKSAIFVSLLVAASALLTGCPKANGYTVVQAYPQLNFDKMLALQPVPGDPAHALLLTQDGVIRRVDTANPAAPVRTFLDLRPNLIADPGPEEGLLGLAFAPDYPASGRFYVFYTQGNPRRSAIARFVAPSGNADHADIGSQKILLQVFNPFQNHNGGSLVFGPDGNLYIGVGDGGSGGDPMGLGQRLDTYHGKVLRIDVSGDGYTIPAGNPFVGRDGAKPEIYAYGLRNPWRMNFDAVTGQLWAGDVGQNRWEEVDRIVAGANYGWGRIEGTHCYPDDPCDAAGTLLPRAEYSHDFGCSVTGGFVYRGREMPELDGWFVYGDYCSGRIWAVDTASDSGAAIPLTDSGKAISSFAQDTAGELYIVTFNNEIDKIVRK